MQIDKFPVKSFPTIDSMGSDDGSKAIRVCIVTEEIIGPVRNGGIASTYYHLSKGLAAQGHEVHVLFLKGRVVQDKTPEHWVEHFADFGVTLHYLELSEQKAIGAAVDWQMRFMAAYQWLRDNPAFDVVHTSEWRGGLIYALMAKRMGLAFAETLFLVKTSSPHIWNRHYQMQPIEKRGLVAVAYAEQKCVELADVVIGGSAHLITFMQEIGYHVPKANVFVQPNIVDFSKVIVTDERPPRACGDLVKTQELIFFGRLEGRKGVEMFCNALDILHERGIAPQKVTFMGKWGAPLATQGGMKVDDYLAGKCEHWDFPVDFITNKNQPEALSHMCSRDMIAVMPSLIENSTMAVYETLENRIPFIATAVGGTPELIDEADHAACLVEPKAQSLADRLEAVLAEGQTIAHSSFSNEDNLTTWYGFHAYLGKQIAEQGRVAAIAQITKNVDNGGPDIDQIGFGALLRRGDDPRVLTAALIADPPDHVLLAYTDATLRPAAKSAVEQLQKAGLKAEDLNCIGQAAGDALNMLASALQSAAMVIVDGAGLVPRPGFLEAARRALARQPTCFFTTFFEAADQILGLPLGGDVASQFLGANAYGPEILVLRKDRYEALGPFEPYDLRHGILHEYITRNVEKGDADLLVYPETLLDWPDALNEMRNIASDTVYAYMKAKPLIDHASLSLRKVLLASLLQKGQSMPIHRLRDGGRKDGEPVWMMPVEWDRNDAKTAGRNKLCIALDESRNRLWLYARGNGERLFKINSSLQAIEVVETYAKNSPDEITLSRFDIPETWEVGTSYAIKWELATDAEETRGRFLRITKLSDDVFAISARNPVLSQSALRRVIDTQLEATQFSEALGLSDNNALDIDELSMPVPMPESKDIPIDEATSIDDLLAMAYNTGRAGLERHIFREKSNAIIREFSLINNWPKPVGGDIRAGLTSVAKEAWSESDWLQGWAWDRADKDRILHVVILQGDTPIFAATADHRLPALGNRTPGLEKHGFRIPVLPEFLDGSQNLHMVVLETRTPLRNGQFSVGSLSDATEPRLMLTK